MAIFRKILLLLFYFLSGFSISANNVEVLSMDSICYSIWKDPESISLYSFEELRIDMDKERIQKWCKLISSLNVSAIRRSTIKKCYFSLCRAIVKVFYSESEAMHKISKGRAFIDMRMLKEDSECTGRKIISRFLEYQSICIAISNISQEDSVHPLICGDLRLLEYLIWGDNKFMDEYKPIPKRLLADVGALFELNIMSLERELYELIQLYSNDSEFLMRNASLLLEASSYLSQYQMGMFLSIVATAFINKGKKRDLIELLNLTFEKSVGRELWRKVEPIVLHKLMGILESGRVKEFHYYRDSLLCQRVECAKYYPHQCPEELKQGADYKEYNERFFDSLDYIFNTVVFNDAVEISRNVDLQLWRGFGCSSQTEFLRVYSEEIMRRYYDENDFVMWGRIERLREYFENTMEYPIDLALNIAECYAPINAIKARDFIRNTSLNNWINKQMADCGHNITILELRAASVIAYIYASLYNEKRYPDIVKYVEWINKNIDRVKGNKDYVIYNVASALSLINKNEESNAWIARTSVDSSYLCEDFNRLLLENYCALCKYNEAIGVASKMNSLTYPDIALYIQAKMEKDRSDKLEELLSAFTTSLSYDFNLLSFMSSDDQDWALRRSKYRIWEFIDNFDIKMWAREAIGDKYYLKFKPYIAAILYNCALASKGALLRSNIYLRDLVLNKMPEEQYNYFRQALEFYEEDFDEDNLDKRVDMFVSENARSILLDNVRNSNANVLTKFDYKIVQNQLQKEDIAIELFENRFGIYFVNMIRKDWAYPKWVTISRDDEEDNASRLWSCIEPYLAGVDKIYISLDGKFNFDNIELAADTIGTIMADKYDIYRVSSTLRIPKDIFISDIKKSVLYGNLKYADANDDNTDSNINGKRGAIVDRWIPLDDTEKEMNEIMRILVEAGIQCVPYQEDKGDKSSFIGLNRQDVDLLHLATHGFCNMKDLSDENAMSVMKLCGIVLSNSKYDLCYKKRSGTIFANEIANMDLNSVKLLVLSACDTANGLPGDDGVFGLQRGFKQSGVGCMIMTLREVNSMMATDLVQSFYSFFAEGQSARKALRNAQKQVALKYSIDDWRSFIIID